MKELIIGIDEVGRGALAGPLVSAAVVLPQGLNAEFSDSKSISRFKRERLVHLVKNKANSIGLGWVSNYEIDQYGLPWALRKSYLRAMENINLKNYKIILDGNVNYLKDYNCEVIIKADSKIPCVSAASIIAKVARDKYMKNKSNEIIGYGFETNVGYGTLGHRQAISRMGLSTLHRKSFCKKLLN